MFPDVSYLNFLAISHAYPQSDQRSATHLRCMVGHSSGHGYYAALWHYYDERGGAEVILVQGCVNTHKCIIHTTSNERLLP